MGRWCRWRDRSNCRSGCLEKSIPKRAHLRGEEHRPSRDGYPLHAETIEVHLCTHRYTIESAHRYVFQKRLKISGAWWKMENLKKVIALRVLRANGDWHYWNNLHQKAA